MLKDIRDRIGTFIGRRNDENDGDDGDDRDGRDDKNDRDDEDDRDDRDDRDDGDDRDDRNDRDDGDNRDDRDDGDEIQNVFEEIIRLNALRSECLEQDNINEVNEVLDTPLGEPLPELNERILQKMVNIKYESKIVKEKLDKLIDKFYQLKNKAKKLDNIYKKMRLLIQ